MPFQVLGFKINSEGELEKATLFPFRKKSFNSESNIINSEVTNIDIGKRSSYYSNDEFWQIEPTYTKEGAWDEVGKRTFGVGGAGQMAVEEILLIIMKKSRPTLIDPSILNDKVVYAAKGRLRTLGSNSSVGIPIYDAIDSRKVLGIYYIKYNIDDEGNEKWEEITINRTQNNKL